MITLSKNKVYEINTESGYFYMNNEKYKNGVYPIIIDTVIKAEQDEDFIKIHKYKEVTI